LRCDDAERDARVNHEVCRQLGIASVVVMPVVNDDQVLGVFELFSGQANAFGERDISAVQRLSEMVETAVRMAHATETLPEQLLARESSVAEAVHAEVFEGQFLSDLVVEEPGIHPPKEAVPSAAEVASTPSVTPAVAPAIGAVEALAPSVRESEAAPKPVSGEPMLPKKPLFWSAAVSPEADSATPSESDQSHVPPVLRGLHKCEACGFPVSAGRALCVECEEKKWRGQLRVPPAASARKPVATASAPSSPKPAGFAAAAPSMAPSTAKTSSVVPSSTPIATAAAKPLVATQPAIPSPVKPVASVKVESQPVPADAPSAVTAVQSVDTKPTEFVLSAGLEPSQSWLARNKYILGVLLIVGGGAVAFFLLR
jgi:hypothetical protein